MKVLLVLAVMVASSTAGELVYKDCGSSAKIIKVFSPDCTNPVCRLKKGHSYSMKISFQPHEAITNMDLKLYGLIAGVPVPFPLPESDGCVLCGNVCPVVAETDLVLTVGLDVKPFYPAMKLTSKWTLIEKSSSDKDYIICIEIPVVIIN